MTLANSTSTMPPISQSPKGAKFCHTLNILLVGHWHCQALLQLYFNYSAVCRSSVIGGWLLVIGCWSVHNKGCRALGGFLPDGYNGSYSKKCESKIFLDGGLPKVSCLLYKTWPEIALKTGLLCTIEGQKGSKNSMVSCCPWLGKIRVIAVVPMTGRRSGHTGHPPKLPHKTSRCKCIVPVQNIVWLIFCY